LISTPVPKEERKMFENTEIEVPCSKCGYKNKMTIKQIRKSPSITCKGCGIEIDIDAKDLDSEFKKVEKSLNDFKKAFKR
jgi:transcription elongation factor Elf1